MGVVKYAALFWLAGSALVWLYYAMTLYVDREVSMKEFRKRSQSRMLRDVCLGFFCIAPWKWLIVLIRVLLYPLIYKWSLRQFGCVVRGWAQPSPWLNGERDERPELSCRDAFLVNGAMGSARRVGRSGEWLLGTPYPLCVEAPDRYRVMDL